MTAEHDTQLQEKRQNSVVWSCNEKRGAREHWKCWKGQWQKRQWKSEIHCARWSNSIKCWEGDDIITRTDPEHQRPKSVERHEKSYDDDDGGGE